jgi:uncharacterized membrane protein
VFVSSERLGVHQPGISTGATPADWRDSVVVNRHPRSAANMSTNTRIENDARAAQKRDSRIAHHRPLRRFVVPPKLPEPISPALVEHAEERARDVQNRVADAITRFSGSMMFVYLHIIWFASWIGFGVESYPFGLLTMIVSLEAIFLSTFVMISQNRADSKRQVIADQQWRTVQEEDQQNRQILDLSEQILELTKAVHEYARAASGDDSRAGARDAGTHARAA